MVEVPGDDPHDGAVGRRAVRRADADRLALGEQPAGAVEAARARRACVELAAVDPARAMTRPSVVVTIAAPSRKPTSCSQQVVEDAAGEDDLDEDLVRRPRGGAGSPSGGRGSRRAPRS